MVSVKQLLFISLLTVLMSACHSSKHFTKMAVKQENGGLLPEAANSYYTALQKKRTNVDAQIGMKRTGQLVLNNLLNDFAKQRNFGDHKSAVYAYQLASNYRDRIQQVGVSLLLSDVYEDDYQKSKAAYLKTLYDEGNQLLSEKKYEQAEIKFKEIKQLDPTYKDAGDLHDVAYLEPLYQSAKAAMAVAHYREAYQDFEKIIERKLSYKDAAALKRECLEKGRFTVAIVDFKNASQTQGLDAKISAYLLNALTTSGDPFLNVVDRDNLQTILTEQQLQMTGVIDESTAVAVGELVGAKAIITGTVLSYSEKRGSLRNKQREGYTAYQDRVLNKTDGKYYMQTMYRPCTFTEYYNSEHITVSFQYKLTNIKTGEIMATEIIERTLEDEIIYGRFDGDANALWPAGQGGPNMNQSDKRALMAMINGRQELKPFSELSNQLFDSVAKQVGTAVGDAVKENVK
jgi:tetratricopeptide (TPR) repeat protein